MAKNIPPDPIPIIDLKTDIPVGCVMFQNYNSEPINDEVKTLVDYFDNKSNDKSYMGNHIYTVNEIDTDILASGKNHMVIIPDENKKIVSIY